MDKFEHVKKIIHSVSITLKGYSLYPHNHMILKRAANNLKQILDDFLQKYDKLRLYVEKEHIIFEGKIVKHQSSKEHNLAALMFRDGIQWIEFNNGLELSELKCFFTILNQNKNLPDEAEGDIVTALWEKNLPHLNYEAEDVLWDNRDLIDFSKINADIDQNEIEKLAENAGHTGLSQDSHILKDYDLWHLTDKEKKILQKMVLIEENWNQRNDVLDVLITILEEQNVKEEFLVILEFIEDELQEALKQKQFKIAAKVLKKIYVLKQRYKEQKPWTIPFIHDFILAVSSSKFLKIFHEIQSDMEKFSLNRIKFIKRFLIQLDPVAILPLGELIIQSPSPRIRKPFMEVIGFLASQNIKPLEKLLKNKNETLILSLIVILRHLKGEKPAKLLFNMIRHNSKAVREKALRTLLHRESESIEKYFSLIDDPEEDIRNIIFHYIGKKRNAAGERFLLDYLENRRYQITDASHILACYKTLGKCGSFLCLSFLQQELLYQGWRYYLGMDKEINRQGAAMALLEMDNEAAADALKKASNNLFPGIRQAYKKAIGTKHGKYQ